MPLDLLFRVVHVVIREGKVTLSYYSLHLIGAVARELMLNTRNDQIENVLLWNSFGNKNNDRIIPLFTYMAFRTKSNIVETSQKCKFKASL